MDYVYLGLVFLLSIATVPTTALSPPLILSPLIKQNKTAEAQKQSLVNPSLFLNVTSHSGFLTVDEAYDSNTFFWYFPVAKKPVNETPWIIWLQGGPGASSLVGIFDEIGPFEYKDGLKLRDAAWTKEYSMVFLDNPIGAGFSFTNSEEGYATNMTTYSNHLYSALQQLLTIFPELRSAPLYIAGESYAGRYVPALASKIYNNKGIDPAVNLKGLIFGNPVFNREDIANLTAVYYNWGLIDTQGALAVKSLQDAYTLAIINKNGSLAREMRSKLVDRLDAIAMQEQDYNLLVRNYYLDDFVGKFIMKEEVQEALHVGKSMFNFSSDIVHKKLVADFLSEVQSKMETLLEHYRILIYCGQLDLTAPCVPSSAARLAKWHWSHRKDFHSAPRTPWWFNKSVAGYVKSGGGLTDVFIRGAGHLVPADKPAEALNLISYFISGLDYPLPPDYKINPEDTPELPEENSDHHKVLPIQLPEPSRTAETDPGLKAGIIISVIANVLLVSVLVMGVIAYYKLKRKSEDFFYSTVDNVSDDIFLT